MKTKSKVFIYLFAMLGMTLLISVSCKKKNDDTNNPPVTTVTDQDGNVYHTVTIGTQVWMVENLKTTKYRNGDGIQNVTDSIAWWNLTSGAYCIYRNDVNNLATYGRLYNWYAVIDSRKLTPAGWHIPTDAEWTTLTDYLGSTCGDKLKEKGPNHWGGDNTATNETGFTALPGGNRAGWQGAYHAGSLPARHRVSRSAVRSGRRIPGHIGRAGRRSAGVDHRPALGAPGVAG